MSLSLPPSLSLKDIEDAIRHQQRNKILWMFPETGPLRRELYRKHMEFFAAGARRRTRGFLAGNRVGKSVSGAYEMALHLTGQYPAWWPGRRFKKGIKAWSCGLTSIKVRDSLQVELMGQTVRDSNGPKNQLIGLGTGMIPADAILATRPKMGTADAIDTAYIRHASGSVSIVHFKSYEAGVDAFSAEKIEVVHLDEEADKDIFVECVMRTMTNDGLVMMTATPLLGMTELIIELREAYMDQAPLSQPSEKTYVVMASWDDAPHLTEDAKRELYAQIPAYQRDARMRGIPQMGSGAIYPVAESDITVAPFEIPKYWPRSYALDVGNNTACVWGTQDRNTGTYYLYREYFRAGAEEAIPPSIHAAAIKGHKDKDAWIHGVIDPAARGRSQTDGQRLLQMYLDLGLKISPSQNAVEAGIGEILDAYATGRLKIFANLTKFWEEFRLYQRDKNGKVIKKRDHLMDAKRYWWLSGRDLMKTEPPKPSAETRYVPVSPYGGGSGGGGGSWMT